jgi:7-cyano-7-deazaguanine synthase
MKKLLVYSGGLDSTVLLYARAGEIDLAVSFDYGSKHNSREIEFARWNTERLKIRHLCIPLGFIGEHFQSSLLVSGGDVPDGHYADPVMKKTVVSFRNGIMLSVACGLAESNDLEAVLIANHTGDHPIYPDCRGDFIQAMGDAMRFGTYAQIRLESPFIDMTKREIALLGKEHGVDYSRTWSCYKGGDIHCGTCGTCIERKEALAGFDPTEYAQIQEKR